MSKTKDEIVEDDWTRIVTEVNPGLSIEEQVGNLIDHYAFWDDYEHRQRLLEAIAAIYTKAWGDEYISESYFVSRTPDGKVWTSSRSAMEVLDQIHGRMDLTFERLDVRTRNKGEDWQPWVPDVATIFCRVIRREILKKQRAKLTRGKGIAHAS